MYSFLKPLLFLFFLLVFSFNAKAMYDFNENCKQAYNNVLCLKFLKALTQIKAEKELNPKNQIPYLIENYIDFLTVIIGEQESDFKHLKNNLEPRLQKFASQGKDSPWFLYSQAILYLQSGVARIKFEEYLNASIDINRSYQLLLENKRKFPDFVMNKAGLGLLHSLIGTVPKKYRWATRTLYFDGTITQGNTELKEACQMLASNPQLNFLLPETAFLLTFVTLNISSDIPAALSLAKKYNSGLFATLTKDSPLLLYGYVNIYVKAGDNDQVIELLKQIPRSADRYPFYYLDYMLGVAKLNRLDADACYPFLNYLGKFKGKNYIRSAYMHLAWYYLLHNDQQKYTMYVNRIKLRGNSQVDNDREAYTFAENAHKPDVKLLKARLLFDGGYYESAKHELDGYKSDNKRNGLEYTYRMGRIYHNWNKINDAIPFYLQTITNGEKLPYFYAANSSLQLGLIYEKKNDFKLAKFYFSKVLSMDFDEYQFSINNKAQAGLNRIKGK